MSDTARRIIFIAMIALAAVILGFSFAQILRDSNAPETTLASRSHHSFPWVVFVPVIITIAARRRRERERAHKDISGKDTPNKDNT